MKSNLKTAFMIAMIVPLMGCLDFGSCKRCKTQEVETDQAVQQAPVKTSCGHAGCTQNHALHEESNMENTISVDEVDEAEDNDDADDEEYID